IVSTHFYEGLLLTGKAPDCTGTQPLHALDIDGVASVAPKGTSSQNQIEAAAAVHRALLIATEAGVETSVAILTPYAAHLALPGRLGFVKDIRRQCVAMSRAKRSLTLDIVGNPSVARELPAWADFHSFAVQVEAGAGIAAVEETVELEEEAWSGAGQGAGSDGADAGEDAEEEDEEEETDDDEAQTEAEEKTEETEAEEETEETEEESAAKAEETEVETVAAVTEQEEN
ncbi:hypothetical protein T492DRAFT_891715, partial [Pavlovales sp. CCMP2436]